VAELVDALASGASELRLVKVQVLLSPPRYNYNRSKFLQAPR
jgi:hypothetical protein